MAASTRLAGGPTLSVNGRSYAGGAVLSVDSRLDGDIMTLINSGWVTLADDQGTTAARPTRDSRSNASSNDPLGSGFRYYDTSLSALVLWTGRGWVNASTGAAA